MSQLFDSRAKVLEYEAKKSLIEKEIELAKLQATPPRKPWVGLTDEEIKAALVSVDSETKRLPQGFRDFARAIEAKLKEKNT